MSQGLIVVLDLGKTLSKLSIWTREGVMIERRIYVNQAVESEIYKSLDVVGIEAWIASTLSDFARLGAIDALIPVGHGAGVVLIKNGQLMLPPMDYEATLPAEVLNGYRAQRDEFVRTGSPALPNGLNLGAQLYWLESLHAKTFKEATLMPWAQYWAWVFSGVAASEVTSLGCHTDLWNPVEARFSDMAIKRGWAEKFAPMQSANNVLGLISPDWVKRTGLPNTMKIYCGVHDSNAALFAARKFPEIAEREATVLSTGTWFVAMRTTDKAINIASLFETLDCLVNIDVFGKAIPSARFMGGREIETLIGLDNHNVDSKLDPSLLLATLPDIVANGTMLLPSFAQGFGPYADLAGRWINKPDNEYAKQASVYLYAALVANTSLDLIGAQDSIFVEGRFAEMKVFVRALQSLRPQDTIYVADAHNDVSLGALLLVEPMLKPAGNLTRVAPLEIDLLSYATQWVESCTPERIITSN